jgi:hypothetical protein
LIGIEKEKDEADTGDVLVKYENDSRTSWTL